MGCGDINIDTWHIKTKQQQQNVKKRKTGHPTCIPHIVNLFCLSFFFVTVATNSSKSCMQNEMFHLPHAFNKNVYYGNNNLICCVFFSLLFRILFFYFNCMNAVIFTLCKWKKNTIVLSIFLLTIDIYLCYLLNPNWANWLSIFFFFLLLLIHILKILYFRIVCLFTGDGWLVRGSCNPNKKKYINQKEEST